LPRRGATHHYACEESCNWRQAKKHDGGRKETSSFASQRRKRRPGALQRGNLGRVANCGPISGRHEKEGSRLPVVGRSRSGPLWDEKVSLQKPLGLNIGQDNGERNGGPQRGQTVEAADAKNKVASLEYGVVGRGHPTLAGA